MTLPCFGFKQGNVAAFPYLFSTTDTLKLPLQCSALLLNDRIKKYEVRSKKSLIFEACA
jgi:hypothetical protein